jgi:hypothetical protein
LKDEEKLRVRAGAEMLAVARRRMGGNSKPGTECKGGFTIKLIKGPGSSWRQMAGREGGSYSRRDHKGPFTLCLRGLRVAQPRNLTTRGSQ